MAAEMAKLTGAGWMDGRSSPPARSRSARRHDGALRTGRLVWWWYVLLAGRRLLAPRVQAGVIMNYHHSRAECLTLGVGLISAAPAVCGPILKPAALIAAVTLPGVVVMGVQRNSFVLFIHSLLLLFFF